jgi:hypothetical protein
MEPYRGQIRRGGVVAFEIAPDAIDIEFTSGWIYHFSYQKPGQPRVERMKELAKAGRGLSTFINKHVKNRFETRRHKADLLRQ